MFSILDIGASGLKAQRLRLDTIAQNIAGMHTTADKNGKNNPYQRRYVVFQPGQANDNNKPGVHVKEIALDTAEFPKVYEPGNKLCDAEGKVKYPNVDMSIEMTNAIEASRAYEANVTMMETTKSMFNSALRLLA